MPVSCTFIGFAPLSNRLSPKATLRPAGARHGGILSSRVEGALGVDRLGEKS